ncbi:hypothetical protein WKI71_44920 [Streptomyces sp. MS1.AVA.1]|uniref:Uncharacterized protein n=1 Tax=Streptomyces machairae TaxID=3134109 RepID=A0ABU8UVK6_9ACTN
MPRVQRVPATMLERLTDLPRSPDHVRAEFGLRVTAAGLVEAKRSGTRTSSWSWSGVAPRAARDAGG